DQEAQGLCGAGASARGTDAGRVGAHLGHQEGRMTATIRPHTGRRKEAVARVRLVPGAGTHTINDRAPLDYLKRETLVQAAFHALVATNTVGRFSVVARVRGGGL